MKKFMFSVELIITNRVAISRITIKGYENLHKSRKGILCKDERWTKAKVDRPRQANAEYDGPQKCKTTLPQISSKMPISRTPNTSKLFNGICIL
ncbi:hypothetical protein TNCV_2199231 [Trichonephila clavipes]|nr:hypothetical protein TNCV_2199231 [Trichonephila clavipes]